MKPATIKSIVVLLLALVMMATLTSELLFGTPKHDGRCVMLKCC